MQDPMQPREPARTMNPLPLKGSLGKDEPGSQTPHLDSDDLYLDSEMELQRTPLADAAAADDMNAPQMEAQYADMQYADRYRGNDAPVMPDDIADKSAAAYAAPAAEAPTDTPVTDRLMSEVDRIEADRRATAE